MRQGWHDVWPVALSLQLQRGSRTLTSGKMGMYITEETLRQAKINVQGRKDRLMLLYILNKALEERVGSTLYGRIDFKQRAELKKKQPEELEQWFFKTFPDYEKVVKDCARKLIDELMEEN